MSPEKKRSDDFSILTHACSKNLPLDMRILGGQSTESYRSRFLGIVDADGPASRTIVIEAPTAKGSIVLMRPGQEVKIVFLYQGTFHSFNTTISGRGRYDLNSRMTVSSLRLRAPESLSTGKIRSFYRLAISDSEKIEVSLGIYAKHRGKILRIRAREKAIITDIGGGGLGFRIAEGRSLLLSVDTRLLLTFRLPEEEEAIHLLGRICFSLRRKESREMFFGVQFIETDSEMRYRKSVDRILHFVAEQQRLSLSNRIDALR